MGRLPHGPVGAIVDATVNVADTVTKAEIDPIADGRSGEIGNFDLCEGLKKLRPPKPADVEPLGHSF